jgi:hypothetical protein
MNASLSVERLPATTWMNRCAAHILDLDCTASELEAQALAQALWDTAGARAEMPEASAEKVFAHWTDRFR